MKLYVRASVYGYKYDFVSGGKPQTVLFDKGYVSTMELLEQYPDATDIHGEQCPTNVRGLRAWMKNECDNTSEYNKAMKICDGLDNGTIDMNNFYAEVMRFTKSVRSDKSIKEWQRIADAIYNIITLWRFIM